MYKSILIIHIILGGLALVSGAMAIFTRKGGKLHIKSGLVYYFAMWGIAISAIIMSLMKFNPFLLAIAIFSLYMTLSGKRSIKYWRLKIAYTPGIKDKLHIYIGFITALFMIGYPIALIIIQNIIFVPVLSVFGTILLLFTIKDFSMYALPGNFQPKNRKWLILHIGQMSGAYIATVTAFLLNNFHIDPPWVLWLLPTAVGIPLITVASRNWTKKLKIS